MLERLNRHETIRENRRRDCAPPFTQPFTTITYRPPVVFSLLSHISSISDMSQFSSSSSTFQVLFDGALQDYKDKTGNALTDHPIARQLEKCESVNSITAILQERARSFREFRENDGKLMKTINSSVDVLCAPSISSALNVAIGLVVRLNPLIHLPVSLMASTAIPASKCNIRWLRYLTHCVSLFLPSHHHIVLTFAFPIRSTKRMLATMHWSTFSHHSRTSLADSVFIPRSLLRHP